MQFYKILYKPGDSNNKKGRKATTMCIKFPRIYILKTHKKLQQPRKMLWEKAGKIRVGRREKDAAYEVLAGVSLQMRF